MRNIALLLLALMLSSPAFAGDGIMHKGEVQAPQPEIGLPKVLQKVGIDQHLDLQMTLSTPVVDELDNKLTLGSFFGKRPVVFVMAYYECPMLCTQVMNATFGCLKTVPFKAGKDYDVVVVSINPKETPALAFKKKTSYVNGYHLQEYAPGYHFLTAPESSIETIAREIGFRYTYDTLSQQYAHASGIMLLTPEGKLSRYFYGIEYGPLDMKLGLMDASNGKIGGLVDQIQLYCYHYDPRNGKYGAAISNLLRLGGGLTLAILSLMFYYMHRKNKLKAHLHLANIA